MTRVELVVPWRPDRYRQRIWDFLRPRYDWPVTEAAGGVPWCKAAAVMPAVSASSATVIAVVDADVWCDGLPDAVRAVENGRPWAVPHVTVRRLAEEATDAVLAGGPMEGRALCQRPYPGVVGGGIVVARREVLLDCPLDPRFVGWGQEDASWGYALTTLHGRPYRGDHDLFHLHHPPQDRMDRKRGSWESVKLERRYRAARFQPKEMRQIIEEIHLAEPVDQPDLHAVRGAGIGIS